MAAAMYLPPPKSEQPINGFDISHFVSEHAVEVWPENWDRVELFSQLGTQWRLGMNGPIGLDYNIAFRLLDDLGLSSEDWRVFFADIRIMEAAALEAMRQID